MLFGVAATVFWIWEPGLHPPSCDLGWDASCKPMPEPYPTLVKLFVTLLVITIALGVLWGIVLFASGL